MDNPMEPADMLPNQEDFDAIMRASLDYLEGWYNGDTERMARSLHPDLVKRTLVKDPDRGMWQLWRSTTAERLVGYTREGGGTEIPESERVYQVTIQDIFRHIASVQCISPMFMDYLHLAKFEDKSWLIVNVLWEVKQGELEPYE